MEFKRESGIRQTVKARKLQIEDITYRHIRLFDITNGKQLTTVWRLTTKK